MRIKRYENYITWRNKKGEFNTECNRASLETDLSLTIPTMGITKVAISRGGNTMNKKLRIRKLTPKETNRLMGFTDTDYENMRKIGMSDSQIYHCNGDSIVVSVLVALFGQLLPISEKDLGQTIENYVEEVKGGT